MGLENTLVYPIVSDPQSPREKVQEAKSTLNISSIQTEDPRCNQRLNGQHFRTSKTTRLRESGEAPAVGIRQSVVYI